MVAIPSPSEPHPSQSSWNGSRGTEAFISYSRRDQAFVRQLVQQLQEQSRHPWVDWDGIYKGEDWWQAIQRGIENAHTFIFVITPDSVESKVCRDEIEYAVQCNKRLLPIVRREGFDKAAVHRAIASHNWLYFRETDDPAAALQELMATLDRDLEYIHAHTRLLVRSKEWMDKRRDGSYLLRGNDLQEAERWQAASVSKQPQLNQLQADYIQASREAETIRQQAQQKSRWIVVLTTLIANLALIAGGCYWLYTFVTQIATNQVQKDLMTTLNVGLAGIDGDRFEVLAHSQPSSTPLVKRALYQEHQLWLQQVHTIFPDASLRTYSRSTNGQSYFWVGDGVRSLHSSSPVPTLPFTQFQESYTPTPLAKAVYTPGNHVAISLTPYRDRLGNWVSAHGAIRDSTGEVVGGLRVDFTQDAVREWQQEVSNALIRSFLVLFLWLLIPCGIILKATHPAAINPLEANSSSNPPQASSKRSMT